MVDGLEEWAGRRPVYRKLAARRRAPPRTCLPSPQIGFWSVYRLLRSTVYLSIAGRATIYYMLRCEPARSHAHGHCATFVSVSMAPSRSLQDPEARSDLGPTGILGPRIGGASVTTSLGQASVRGSTEPRWRFGEITNGWIWCNLARLWWIHEACGGGCGRGRWDPPDQREIRRDPAVFKQIQQFCVLNVDLRPSRPNLASTRSIWWWT